MSATVGSSSGVGMSGDCTGYCITPSVGSASPGTVLTAVVPLFMLEASTVVCVPSVTGVLVTTFVIPVSTCTIPIAECECNTVTVTRGLTLTAGVVTGLTTGGPSSEYPRRGLAPSTNALAATVVPTGMSSAVLKAVGDGLWLRDPSLLASVPVVSLVSATVTKDVVSVNLLLVAPSVVPSAIVVVGPSPAW